MHKYVVAWYRYVYNNYVYVSCGSVSAHRWRPWAVRQCPYSSPPSEWWSSLQTGHSSTSCTTTTSVHTHTHTMLVNSSCKSLHIISKHTGCESVFPLLWESPVLCVDTSRQFRSLWNHTVAKPQSTTLRSCPYIDSNFTAKVWSYDTLWLLLYCIIVCFVMRLTLSQHLWGLHSTHWTPPCCLLPAISLPGRRVGRETESLFGETTRQ